MIVDLNYLKKNNLYILKIMMDLKKPIIKFGKNKPTHEIYQSKFYIFRRS